MIQPGHTIKVLDKGYVRYVDHMGTDQRICESARISYHSASKGEESDKKLLNYLWKNKHTSPFEMCKVTFNIKLPIFVMRQYVRHRMQNLNEVSARYTELPNEFYIPEKWRKQDTKNKQGSLEDNTFCPEIKIDGKFYGPTVGLELVCKKAYDFYQELLSQNVAREMARMILPINIYTEIYSCWDLKNLLHFISLREDSHAQAEIQEYSKAMKQILVELFPWTMEVYNHKNELKS